MLNMLTFWRADGDELGFVEYSESSFTRARIQRLFERVLWRMGIIYRGRLQ
jgi:hypothetical protein